MNHPALLIFMTLAGAYLGRLWWSDRNAAAAGSPEPNAFPGATPAPIRATVIAVTGALVLLAIETWGETALGLAAQQSRMTWLFAAYSVLGAPIIEELIFRGWIVVPREYGNAAVWSGAVAASLLFAVLHPFLWHWDDAGFALTLGLKGSFSTLAVFTTSLWLYAARLAGWNPQQSLLPCFGAHAARNAGVVVIKAAAGFMGGGW